MNFVYPQFLWALTALAIPIIIHLFNFRRYKTVLFSNVKFLQEVQQQTKSNSRLKNLLILLARLLAIAFLVLTFSQPILIDDAVKNKTGKNAVSIYLDNSYSMNSVGAEADLFNVGKQYARNITEAYTKTTEFQLITNNFLGEQQRLYNHEGTLNLIDKTDPTYKYKSFNDVATRQSEVLLRSEAKNKTSYFITDGQKAVFENLPESLDSNIDMKLIYLEAQLKNNVFVDSCWFVDPIRKIGQPEELKVRIKNTGNDDLTGISVKLFLNDQQKAISSIDLLGKESKEIDLGFTLNQGGIINGKIEITDYPITFDDQFFFSYQLINKINVLVINEQDSLSAFNKLFKTDPFFNFNQQFSEQLNLELLDSQHFVILYEMNNLSTALIEKLNQYLINGGAALYIPPIEEGFILTESIQNLGIPKFGDLVKNKVQIQNINYEHPVFKNVFSSIESNLDLPILKKYYTVTPPLIGVKNIFTTDNKQLFIGEVEGFSGGLYYATSSFNDSSSTFKNHALFVPVLYQMALQGVKTNQLFNIVGLNQLISINLSSNTNYDLTINNEALKIEIIPEVKKSGNKTMLKEYNQIEQAGHYNIMNGTQIVAGVAYNYDRNESELDYYSKTELVEMMSQKYFNQVSLLDVKLDEVTKALKYSTSGTPLWQFMLILTLIFLLIEMALLRLLK